MEDDTDREVEELKERYEAKLKLQRGMPSLPRHSIRHEIHETLHVWFDVCICMYVNAEATLRLKGENGIMKKKFSALKKDIEDQKEELKAMVCCPRCD